MGDLEACRICRRPVLELEGQFEVLQPYCGEPGHPALKIAGWLHTPCLVGSEHGETWAQWQVNHYTTVRGYEILSDADGWTVLGDRQRRALLALRRDGASISAERTNARVTPCEGGGTLAVEHDFHLTLDDAGLVAALQQDLEAHKRVPLARVVDALEIRDRLQWPGVLETGAFVFSRKLRRDWTPRSISARAAYEQLLPDVVLAAWKAL